MQFVRSTGWLPQWLGFAVPDAATLLRPELAGAAAQRAWAWWLLGSVAVYGLLLRLLCALWCWVMWRRGQARLVLDEADPGVRRLLARFEAMEPAQVVDAEHAADAPARVLLRTGPETAERWLLGFELPPEADWPAWPPASDVQVRRIEGTQAERAAVLQALAAAPPRRLLIVCHAPSSPDRGTERFVREASGLAGACGLLLQGARQAADAARWQDWLQRTGLAQVQIHTDPPAAQAWLEAA